MTTVKIRKISCFVVELAKHIDIKNKQTFSADFPEKPQEFTIKVCGFSLHRTKAAANIVAQFSDIGFRLKSVKLIVFLYSYLF